MDYAIVISAVVLGLSVLATAAKFLDWFFHSDPKTMVRTIRWMMLLFLIAGIPLLVAMISREQWAGAMLLGACMVVVGAFLNWRTVLTPMRSLSNLFRRRPAPFEMPPVAPADWEVDPRDVQRAAALLDAYVKRTGAVVALPSRGPDEHSVEGAAMAVQEALAVLGLPAGVDLAAVHAAHRRLMRGVDPDDGGSPYLAERIDLARDVLVGVLRHGAGPAAVESLERKRLTKG